MANVDEAVQFLKKDEEMGGSLFDHLSRVMLDVIVKKPNDANGMFEHISAGVRATSFVPPVPAPEGEAAAAPSKAPQLEYCAATMPLYAPPAEDAGSDLKVADIVGEAKLYEAAGVSFGADETFRLFLAIKNKSAEVGAPLKLFGKIIGTQGSYYVAYGEVASEEEIDATASEGANGINKYAYYVCAYAGAPWTKLPTISPDTVVVARKIRRFFSGDVNAPVPCYPPLPGGTEGHLLAAVVTQILSECACCPSGYLEGSADDGRAIAAAEETDGVPDTLDGLKELGSWTHAELEINSLGRMQEIPPSDDEDAEVPEGQDFASSPAGGLDADDETAWAVRTCPGGAAETPASAAVLKSLTWPGAFAVGAGKMYANVYSGYGVKRATETYTQPMPPAIQAEWAPAEDAEDAVALLTEDKDVVEEPPKEEEDE